jgi:O-antigen/teichoic acid export membrane protein
MSLISFNDQKRIAWMNGCAVIMNVFLNLWLIPKYGLVGATISAAISEVLILGIEMFFLRRRSSFFPPFSQMAKIFIASLLMGLFAKFCIEYFPSGHENGIFLLIIAFPGGMYLLILFLLRFFTKEMRELSKIS